MKHLHLTDGELTYAFDPLEGGIPPAAIKRVEEQAREFGFRVMEHATWFDSHWPGDPEGSWMVTYRLERIDEADLPRGHP